jgi:hypothetical protein
MRRLALLPLALFLAACPGDKKPKADTVAAAPPPDTTPVDLSGTQAAIPPAAPDTFTRRKLPQVTPGGGQSYPEAPAALVSAVQREQSFSKFCFQEFGQKADPSLRGGVAMLVTVGSSGITDAKVGNSSWSGRAGAAVNRCLNEKAKLAWKIAPGAVKPGTYRVPLTFSGV